MPFSGEGYETVLARLWPLLGSFNPALVLRGPVSGAAMSQARTRLPPGALREVFEAGAQAGSGAQAAGLRVFGLVVTAVDGTVFDLAAAEDVAGRFATPSGAGSRRRGWSPWWCAGPAGCRPRPSARARSASRCCGWSVGFSPDGVVVVSGSGDRSVRLWEAATGRQIAMTIGVRDGWAALLPDGSYNLVGEPDGSFWWILETVRLEPGELDGYDPTVRRIAEHTPLPLPAGWHPVTPRGAPPSPRPSRKGGIFRRR